MSLMILDGALGTELCRRGFDTSDSLWSARVLLDHPEAVEQIHLDYLEAGAACITSASYQISTEGFEKAGLTREDADRAFVDSVEIAKRARARFRAKFPAVRSRLVAASVGPYGGCLADGSEFHGNYDISPRKLLRFHSERIARLGSAQPDLFACETIPSLEEASVLLESLQQCSAIPAWLSFTCRDGLRTVHGDLISDCARIVGRHPQVVALGVNCTSPDSVSSLVSRMRPHSDKSILVYPNSGQTWDARTRAWIGKANAPAWEHWAVEWVEAGANWIGGCCGTTPETIRIIRRALELNYPAEFTGEKPTGA